MDQIDFAVRLADTPRGGSLTYTPSTAQFPLLACELPAMRAEGKIKNWRLRGGGAVTVERGEADIAVDPSQDLGLCTAFLGLLLSHALALAPGEMQTYRVPGVRAVELARELVHLFLETDVARAMEYDAERHALVVVRGNGAVTALELMREMRR